MGLLFVCFWFIKNAYTFPFQSLIHTFFSMLQMNIILLTAVFTEDEITYFTDSEGERFETYKYGNEYFPIRPAKLGRTVDPRIHAPAIQDMTVREDDVFLCAYFKAGITRVGNSTYQHIYTYVNKQ